MWSEAPSTTVMLFCTTVRQPPGAALPFSFSYTEYCVKTVVVSAVRCLAEPAYNALPSQEELNCAGGYL